MRTYRSIAILILLAACTPAQAAFTPSPSNTAAIATVTTNPPTATPTLPATVTPASEPASEGIHFLAPGPDSRVTSPIQFSAQLPAEAGKLALVELVGRDGRLITRILLRAAGTSLDLEIPFEVREAERGRLSLSLEDEFGRTIEAASVELTLLPGGEATIQAPEAGPALAIESPQGGETISRSEVEVQGQVSGSSPRPLTVQAINRAGRVLATTDVYPDGGGDFSVALDIAVEEESWVLLTVSRSGGDVPGLWFLKSVEVLLLP